MMKKTGPAAIVLASVTVKSVVFGRLGILSIYVGKNTVQPIKKCGQNRIVNINRMIRHVQTLIIFSLTRSCQKQFALWVDQQH